MPAFSQERKGKKATPKYNYNTNECACKEKVVPVAQFLPIAQKIIINYLQNYILQIMLSCDIL